MKSKNGFIMIFKKFFNKDIGKAESLSKVFNLPPRIMELILSRGISTEAEIEEFLNPKKFADPFLLKGMRELVDRVTLAREMKDRVLIFGDYDVDGISATAIMLKALEMFGIKANYYLPNRFVDGYGLTNDVIDKVVNLYDPNLIITVDCGISCHDEVEYAKTKGVEICVTDHHEIPEVLPETIVVNAKIEVQAFPDREICGTGVAFKFAQALLGVEKAEQFLPIAAIATIADIVPLLNENRAIVSRGLKLCDKYLPIGLKMMFKEYEISTLKPNAVDISFKVTPKLNASGRMGDAADSLKLYLETDPTKAKKLIEKIKNHNIKRQELCNKIYDDCEKALAKQDMRMQRVICLASKVWDKGVLGIVCSRLVDKYHKPTFLFAQDGDELCGSGRSIDDINIHQLLSSLSEILDTFGGHSMAAGLSLKRKNYEEFVQKINAFALQNVNDEVFIPIRYYDQEISLEELTPEFVKQLSMLEPFGCGNPRPKFKITTPSLKLTPMRYAYQHANILLGDSFEMQYFNYLDNINKINFSRQKSFIFELRPRLVKGSVVDFDGGSFIAEDAFKKLNPIKFVQLCYPKTSEAKYTLYPKEQLLNFVSGTTTSVFGTAFVTYSCQTYVEFSKNYSTSNIYHFGVHESREIGYNSLLLSPKGLDWAKNYNKIVFLSPVLDSGFIAALNKVTNAEIYLPLEANEDTKIFSNLDLSRETFGRVFNALKSRSGKPYLTIFDLYDSINFANISFATFYVAFLVFNQLELIQTVENERLTVYVNKDKKCQLSSSSLYGSLCLLKNTFGRKNG